MLKKIMFNFINLENMLAFPHVNMYISYVDISIIYEKSQSLVKMSSLSVTLFPCFHILKFTNVKC